MASGSALRSPFLSPLSLSFSLSLFLFFLYFFIDVPFLPFYVWLFLLRVHAISETTYFHHLSSSIYWVYWVYCFSFFFFLFLCCSGDAVEGLAFQGAYLSFEPCFFSWGLHGKTTVGSEKVGIGWAKFFLSYHILYIYYIIYIIYDFDLLGLCTFTATYSPCLVLRFLRFPFPSPSCVTKPSLLSGVSFALAHVSGAACT